VSAAKNTRPSGEQWDFTGTTSGGDLWILPKSQNSSVLFLGIGTEEIAVSDLGSNITLVFQGLSGPAGGVFSMWDVDQFATLVPLVTSTSGFTTPNQIVLPANAHAHFNYGFTTPGLYDVTFQASATLAPALGGGPVVGTATFSFGVFDVGDLYPEEPATPYTFFGRTFDNFIYDNGHVDLGIALAPVPEPSALLMAGLGLCATIGAGLRRRRAARSVGGHGG
jgi:surface-anchored protein